MNAPKSKRSPNSENRCLVCGDDSRNGRRGLCSRHYQQFNNRKRSLTPAAAEAWEEVLVADGKLLPSRQGRRSDATDDAFAESFREFTAQVPGALKADEIDEDDISADEAIARAKEVALKRAAKKTAKRSKTPTTKRKTG